MTIACDLVLAIVDTSLQHWLLRYSAFETVHGLQLDIAGTLHMVMHLEYAAWLLPGGVRRLAVL